MLAPAGISACQHAPRTGLRVWGTLARPLPAPQGAAGLCPSDGQPGWGLLSLAVSPNQGGLGAGGPLVPRPGWRSANTEVVCTRCPGTQCLTCAPRDTLALQLWPSHQASWSCFHIRETGVTLLGSPQHRASQEVGAPSHRVPLFSRPWTAAHQASLPITNSWSFHKLTSIESAMPSNLLTLCRPLLLPPSIFPTPGPFPMSRLFASGATVLELHLRHQSSQCTLRTDLL